MKKIFIPIILLCMTSVTLMAGTFQLTDENSAVLKLRTRFKNGKEPQADYLLNNSFICNYFSAIPGDSDESYLSYPLSFKKLGGLIVLKQERAQMDKKAYQLNGRELMGSNSFTIGRIYDSFRVDDKGILLGQFASAITLPNAAELSSIAMPQAKVNVYTLCTPK